MKHVMQQGEADCGFACLAMILETTIERVELIVGHRAEDRIEGDDEPMALTDQEVVNALIDSGRRPVTVYTREFFERFLQGRWSRAHVEGRHHWTSVRLSAYLVDKEAVLLVNGTEDGLHYVAWDGERVLNPNGRVQEIPEVEPIYGAMVLL